MAQDRFELAWGNLCEPKSFDQKNTFNSIHFPEWRSLNCEAARICCYFKMIAGHAKADLEQYPDGNGITFYTRHCSDKPV